jgi:hypothetical protein
MHIVHQVALQSKTRTTTITTTFTSPRQDEAITED